MIARETRNKPHRRKSVSSALAFSGFRLLPRRKNPGVRWNDASLGNYPDHFQKKANRAGNEQVALRLMPTLRVALLTSMG